MNIWVLLVLLYAGISRPVVVDLQQKWRFTIVVHMTMLMIMMTVAMLYGWPYPVSK